MSYDLTLFRMPDAMDPSEAYEQLMEREERGRDIDHPPTASELAAMQEVVRGLVAWWPALEIQLPAPAAYLQLTEKRLEVQIEVCPEVVRITMPYFRKPVREMMECAVGCIETVYNTAGYSAYDPQADQFVTAADLEQMIMLYCSVQASNVLLEVAAKHVERRPWWRFW